MELTKQITVNASADRVWKVIGTDFNNISEWASFVASSEANPDLPEGGGRVCKVDGFGDVVETIFDYSDENRELAFTLEGGTPFFMQRVENSWQVEALDENRSVVTIGVNAQMMPVFKQLLTSRLSKVFQKRMDVILGELKEFAENESVHA